VAWESSQPHVVASGYVQLSLFGLVIAKVSAKVAVLICGTKPQVEGGQQTRYEIKTAQDWCEFYGVPVEDGVATLYKAVDNDFLSGKQFLYKPGTSPAAPDWDGGADECGGGLHFCASPGAALGYFDTATRFVACKVAIADMRAPQEDDLYQNKIKASRICGPIVEVDRYGKPVEQVGTEAKAC
jgi:hypothetical protein